MIRKVKEIKKLTTRELTEKELFLVNKQIRTAPKCAGHALRSKAEKLRNKLNLS